MKKTLTVLMAGIVAVGTGLYIHSRASAQGGAAAAPRTRIALLNLNYVIKNYAKYKNFQAEMKREGEGHQKTIQAKTKLMETLKGKLTPATTAEQREQIEGQMRTLKREVEDITVKARRELARKGSEAMVTIYKEVREAAQRHAMSNNFDLVLHFEEATTEGELDTAKNIMRKMNAGGCVPMYWRNGMDISWHVMNSLNAKYKAAGSR